MSKTVILAKRPDLVLKLEKYDLLPEGKKGGIYEGIAKKWAKENKAPYDTPENQALAKRLPTGWEELTQEEFKTLLEKIKETIGKKKQAKPDTPNRGSETMLKSLTQVAFLGIATVATLLVEQGIGILPDEDPKEKKRAKDFSFELLLHLINGADFLTTMFRSIAKTAQTTKENQELIAEILKLAAIFIAVLAASEGNQEKFKRLIFSFKQAFSDGIDKTEAFVSHKLKDKAISGKTAERAALCLQQAKIALKKDDFEGFNSAFYEALEMIDLSPELFIGEIEELRKFAKHLHRLITAGLKDNEREQTAISQAM